MTELERLTEEIFAQCEKDGEPVTMKEAEEMAKKYKMKKEKIFFFDLIRQISGAFESLGAKNKPRCISVEPVTYRRPEFL